VPRLSHPRTIRIGIVAVYVSALLSVAAAIWMDRRDAIDSGVKEARNVAIVLGAQIERSVQSMDAVIRELQRRVSGFDTWSPNERRLQIPQPARFYASLVEQLSLMPEAFHIGITDASGKLIMSSASWPPAAVEFSDRDYFLELQSNDDDRMSISQPITSRVTGMQTIVLARRLNDPEGNFTGVVYISARYAHFEGTYRAITSLHGKIFSIIRSDGTFLVHYPNATERAGTKVFAQSPWHDAVVGGHSRQFLEVFDEVAQWVALEPVKGYPLLVGIAIPQHLILEQWRSRAALMGFGTGVLLIFAALLLRVMTRQYESLGRSQDELVDKQDALERVNARLLASEAELVTQNGRFDAALNNMTQGLVMYDADARLVVCNERFQAMYGLSAEDVRPGRSLREIIASDGNKSPLGGVDAMVDDVMAMVSKPGSSVHEFPHSTGRIFSVTICPMKTGGWVSTHEDVTDIRNNEAHVRRLAHSDLLTSIPNRSSFIDKLENARQRLRSDGRPFSLLMLDLDRFKDVNDSLGHAVGDVLLKETAQRLLAALRSTDVVARLGGDEFAIIQGPQRTPRTDGDAGANMREQAIVLANRIIELVGEPYDIDGRKVVIGASIGIAIAPVDGIVPDELMKKADLALYRVKADGRNGYALFDAELAQAADERHRLEVDLRQGLARNEFELHYQPVAKIATRRVCCMEALVRWRHPTLGLVTPDRFISVAEDTGLITSLGEWIIQAACLEAAHWPPDVKIAVNVSPVQLRKSNLFDVILCALVDSGLPPERLEIEITERVLLDKDGDHLSTLRQLQNLGVSIALDDFGTGYSSLSYLKQFRFDKIKIDRSFTGELLERPECAAIVCAVIGMGRALNIVTVAEGVETEDQMLALRAAGVDQVQGWLTGRPLPARELRFEDVPAVDGRIA
jgi:diguanylate cyclase (GGDEF)-like protein/PAS domain S-box-containing protein